MKLSCLQENLAKGLGIIIRAVQNRTSLPITQNVLLETDGGRLKLSATDLAISITTWVGAQVEEEGAVTVPARLLSEVVSSLPPERIDIEMMSQPVGINVQCANTDINVSGLPAEDFPPIPTIDEGVSGEISVDVLKEAVARVASAAATDDSRPVLTGVNIEVSGTEFTMAAADGFRLAVFTGNLEKPLPSDYNFIIPAKTLEEVSRLAGNQENAVEFMVTSANKQVLFSLDAAEVVSNLIQGNFPNYESLIPQEHQTRVVIPSNALMQATRTASVFAKTGGGQNGGIIRLEMEQNPEGQDVMKISSRSEEIGDNEGVIFVNLDGEDSKIAFNSKYLSDALDALNFDNIVLETSGSSSPGVFKPEEASRALIVVMPMYVQW